jgi:tight adherence protein C
MLLSLLISISFFALIGGAIVLFGYKRYVRPSRMYEQLSGEATFVLPEIDRLRPEEPGLAVRIVEKVGEAVPIDPSTAGFIRSDLMAAGYRNEGAVAVFVGLRILFCVALLSVTFLLRTSITSNAVIQLVIPVACGIIGYLMPGLVLNQLINARQDRIRLALADALDLLVVAIEAGLGMDQAIQHVGRELISTYRDIGEELQLVNLEIRAGKRRSEALRNLADRTGEPELRKLVAVLIQTDRFGTSVADSLRSHSEFLRTRRRQEAEERAGKVGVKLVFPIFFLILPSMLTVAAGPGMLQVFKVLFPLMRQARI